MAVKMSYDAKRKVVMIEVPFDKDATYSPSASGKTLAVDTTHGAQPVEGSPDPRLRVNLSAWLSLKG